MKYTTIKEHHLFEKAYKKGARFTGRLFSVFVLKDLMAQKLALENPLKKQYNRLGISASKKYGMAVERNRAKRILRVGYRYWEPKLKKGWLVVVTPRDTMKNVKSTEIISEMRFAFKKLNMFLEEEK